MRRDFLLPPPHKLGLFLHLLLDGGFQPFEVMRFVRRLGMAGAGAFDVTEYAPLIDTTKNTGNILATLMCEFMAGAAHHRQQNGG